MITGSALTLGGCQTASDAASSTASAVGTAVEATGSAVTSLVTATPQGGPSLQRHQMEQQAGSAHFANPQLVAARGKMQTTRSEFGARRDKFVSSPFVGARDQFRGGGSTPTSGPIIGSAVGDTAASLALLAAAQSSGVPLPIAQPVLAQLLPGFGY